MRLVKKHCLCQVEYRMFWKACYLAIYRIVNMIKKYFNLPADLFLQHNTFLLYLYIKYLTLWLG